MSNISVYREAILEEALKFIGGTAVAIGIVGWLMRSLIKHFLDKDVELFRQSLQSQAAVELEKLKHELRLAAVSYEKQVTLLQEKRASVIAKLYSKLIDFLDAAESLASLVEFSGEPSKTDKAKVLAEKAAEFMGYFARNRICRAGLGQWVKGHYAALSTIAYGEPLLFLVRAERAGMNLREIASILLRYWSNEIPQGGLLRTVR
jgi:hypothetical protein